MELARNIKVESVEQLVPTSSLCLQRDNTVAEAVAAMRRQSVGCVLVLSGDRLAGIFTERDLLRRVLATGQSLAIPLVDCMTTNPVVVQGNEPIAVAMRRMEEGGYRHLPVVDGQGRPIGVVSVKSIVHYLVEHFPSTIHCLPPDPEAFPQRPEGA